MRLVRENRLNIYVVVTLIAVVIATRVGGAVAIPPTFISTFWAPNAILLAALLLMAGPQVKFCLVFAYPAYLIGELWGGYSFDKSLLFAFVNCLEVAVAYACVRVWCKAPYDLQNFQQFAVVILAIIVASLIGGVAGASGVSVFGGSFGAAFVNWVLSDFVGFFVFAPLVLTLPAWCSWMSRATVIERSEAAFLCLLMGVVSAAVYGPYAVDELGLVGSQFIPIPIILGLALRFGPKGAAVGLVIMSVTALHFVLAEQGPFSQLGSVKNVEMLQFYITSIALASMSVGVLIAERNTAKHALETTNAEIEERIVTRTAELQNSRDEAEAAELQKGQLIATMSHELRTPLTSMIGSLRMLTQKDIPLDGASRGELIEVAWRNSGQLASLVDDIVNVERLEAGAVEMQLKNIDVSELVDDVVILNKGYAMETGVRLFATEIAPGNCVNVDKPRILQVFANLVSNACKFSPSAGVVTLSIKSTGELVTFSVSDDGEGIPEGLHATLFDKYVRGENTDARNTKGAGLGLNIAKAIVEGHGGNIGFSSIAGGGTTFYFTLPLSK